MSKYDRKVPKKAQIRVNLTPELKKKFMAHAKSVGKSASSILEEIIRAIMEKKDGK